MKLFLLITATDVQIAKDFLTLVHDELGQDWEGQAIRHGHLVTLSEINHRELNYWDKVVESRMGLSTIMTQVYND
jgi:hypothetical protein